MKDTLEHALKLNPRLNPNLFIPDLKMVLKSARSIGAIILVPISFGIYQVRIADALLPLSIILRVPSAIGLEVGCLVVNVYGGLRIIDIVGDPIANFIACILAWYIAKKSGFLHRLLGTSVETIVITIIVGGYLSLIFNVPIELGLLEALMGSIIAINILGFALEEGVRRSGIVRKIWIVKGRMR